MPVSRIISPAAAALMLGLLAQTAGAHETATVPPAAPAMPTIDLPPVPVADSRPVWKQDVGPDPQARHAWLAECRRNQTRADNGVGGGIIGGFLGGVIGNRVAGKHHRTVGTIAGAAVGAAAGAAIDRAEDRDRQRDWCESYLDDYYARASQTYGYAYPGHGYGFAYAQPMMMVPTPMMMHMAPVAHRQREQECTEEVTYEYVDVPVRARRIERRPVRHVPDNRVRISGKRIPL